MTASNTAPVEEVEQYEPNIGVRGLVAVVVTGLVLLTYAVGFVLIYLFGLFLIDHVQLAADVWNSVFPVSESFETTPFLIPFFEWFSPYFIPFTVGLIPVGVIMLAGVAFVEVKGYFKNKNA